MNKLIKNVVTLDMTSATAESVVGVTVDNAVIVLVTPTTRPLLGQINIGNMVGVVEIPDNATLSTINGNIVIDGNFEHTTTLNVFKMLNGSILIKNDVTPETLGHIFTCGGDINGNITLPDSLTAVLPALVRINGNINSYPADSLLYDQKTHINNGFLRGLPESSKITFTHGTVISPDTNVDTFKKYIKELTIFGNTILPQQLRDVFYETAQRYDRVIEIPVGYTFYDESLAITPSSLLTLKGKSIYTCKDVHFMNGISESLLRQLNFHLITEGAVILPENIVEMIFDKIQANHLYTYRGKLIIVQSDLPFVKSGAPASYLIKSRGTLIIPESSTPGDIQESINEIFLYGTISLQKDQMQTINDKLAVYKGKLIDPEEDDYLEAEQGHDTTLYDVVISNAVSYKL